MTFLNEMFFEKLLSQESVFRFNHYMILVPVQSSLLRISLESMN